MRLIFQERLTNLENEVGHLRVDLEEIRKHIGSLAHDLKHVLEDLDMRSAKKAAKDKILEEVAEKESEERRSREQAEKEKINHGDGG